MSDNEIAEELELFGLNGFGGDTIRTQAGANHVLRFLLEGPGAHIFNLVVDDHQLRAIRDKASELLKNSADAAIELAELALLDPRTEDDR